MEIFAQTLGFIGLGLILLSFQFPRQKTVIRVQLYSSLVFAVHYLLLGAVTGALLNLIGICRALIFSNREHPWARKKWWLPLFCISYCIVYVLMFTVWDMEASPRNLLLELLPVIGSLATTIGFHLDNVTMRKLALVNGGTWVVYAILCGSIGGALTEAVGIVSVLIGLRRLKRTEKPLEVNHD